MPGITGFDLIARVRDSSRSEIRDLPAVALTAYARSEDRTKALLAGFVQQQERIGFGMIGRAVRELEGQIQA